MIRWYSHCALGNIIRVHAAVGQPWRHEDGTTEDTIRRYLQMRYTLMPTYIAGGHLASTSGFPIVARCDLFWPVQYYDLGQFSRSLPDSNETFCVFLKPPARAHTAAPHCGSHCQCHQLRVILTLRFLRQAHAPTSRVGRPVPAAERYTHRTHPQRAGQRVHALALAAPGQLDRRVEWLYCDRAGHAEREPRC